MKSATTPIRRSPELAPLSREHHDDLLFAWKIKQGMKLKTDPDRIAAYCEWFYKTHLQQHFAKEERSFSRIVSPYHAMMRKMFEDHECIKMKLDEISQFATYGEFARLAQIISYHIRYEERQLFNYIQSIATPSQLATLAEELEEKADTKAVEWIDEFWIKKN